MKPRLPLFLLCCLASLWPLATLAAIVQPTLDRNRIQLGETVTLNVRVEGTGMASPPDLSALSQDFAVLQRSQNASFSLVNGVPTSSITLGIALRPLHAGTLRIPPLEIAGQTTAPIDVEVVPADPNAAAAVHKDVFIEASVDPARVYVGQQMVYTLRLFYAAESTISGGLDNPALPGVDVRALGREINYQAERDGKRYNVVERRYALTPQHEGRMQIPGVPFQGESVNMSNPDAFFGNGEPVSAVSPPVDIEVRPQPAPSMHGAWLPARDLTLTLDGGPAQGDLRVGEPVNLSMDLQATGLPYEALPSLSLPTLDGATVYPDKPVNGTRPDGEWLVGRRQQGFAVVPNRAGKLTIPETTLTWWNVVTDHEETARIPARTFNVLPAAGAPAAASTAAQAEAIAPATAASVAATEPANGKGLWWRWLALGSLGLWIVSVIAWWWLRRRRAPQAPDAPQASRVSTPQTREAFLAAARGNDTARQAHALLAWAQGERPGLQNLGELSQHLASEPQIQAIAALQRQQYAGHDEAGLGDRLAKAFGGGFVWRDSGAAANDSPLPPLYPFKVRR